MQILIVSALCSLLSGALAQTQSYLVISNAAMPTNIDSQISRAGGTITKRIPEAGMIVASSGNPKFSAGITGASVVKNIQIQTSPPEYLGAVQHSDVNSARVALPAGSPMLFTDPLQAFQWGLDAVNAPEAWASGSTGAGVRVAVIDTGFNLEHPDLKPNINLALSKDFTGEGLSYGPSSSDPRGLNSHGSHVAGIIAAAGDGRGIIGVAPNAELVLLKALFNNGTGTFEDVIAAITYAADQDADVINLSLGSYTIRGEGITPREIAALRVAATKAVNYAHNRGALVIVAAGNDKRDLNGDRGGLALLADLPNSLAISATAPFGWARNFTTSLDNFASYSNYGSAISFAAPGGDGMFPATEMCSILGFVATCRQFDFVVSTGGREFNTNGVATDYYFWAAGTSMAAPHASGIAALIIGNNGGIMQPAKVKAAMAARAKDLGRKGKDPYFGAGGVSSGY